jgi:hypothetical protein
MHPHIVDYAFSYRSGWLMYTPVMVLAIAGFIPLLLRGPQRVMIAVFTGIAFYIVSAWDVWWYAGMGGRAMVQYYPALLVPLAALFTWLSARKLRMLAAAPVLLLLMYVNVWFTWHAHGGSLYDADGGMSGPYYRRVIGRWHAPPEVQKLKDGPYLYEGPAPASARQVYALDTTLQLDSARQDSPLYLFAFRPRPGERWLRASADFCIVEQEPMAWQMTQFVLDICRDRRVLREGMVRVQRFAAQGEQKRLWVDLELPAMQAGDSVGLRFWHAGSNKILEIRDLQVWAF